CGYEHTLALDSDGRAYAWGDNNCGQIGCRYKSYYIWTPIEIEFSNNYKIQSIYCCYNSSFAITSDGHVFSWGNNYDHELGHNINDDKQENENTILYPTKNEDNSNINDNLNDSNFKTQFIEMSAIGSGGFGTVFKVKHRLDDKIYAVKRLQFGDFNEENKLKVLREVKSLAKLDTDFVVKYYNSWLESNHLYIQMEFCAQNLRSLLTDKAIVFARQPEDEMNIFEYFISCQIFTELLESVQYLHESNPVIIHRDLKPGNILIDPNFKCNRCVKLCDFGLATAHNTDGHTDSRYEHSVVGTRRYIAPEVYSGKYNHKSDIYSLYIIGEQLFDIDFQSSQTFQANESVLKSYLLCIYRTLLAMMSTPFWRQRPECRQVLAKHKEWSIDKTVVTKQKEFNSRLIGIITV
ncbi:unnamed protein product, partial [Medioppia subpectinata]